MALGLCYMSPRGSSLGFGYMLFVTRCMETAVVVQVVGGCM